MFHRRRASPNPKRHSMPVSLSAAAYSAATQAFLKTQESNASLAAAAAGTALRSHTQTPTPVDQTQTKRTQRRDLDGVVTNRYTVDRPGSGLQRTDSAGSMTERTFRPPSPGRGTSPSRNGVPAAIDAPPVPDLPEGVPNIPAKSHKRAASLEPPLRVTSPLPKLPGGRGVSLDRGTRVQASPPSAGRTKLEQISEVDRENSQRSINFSRPLSPGPPNPPARPHSEHTGWFTTPIVSGQLPRQNIEITRPRTADGISQADVTGIQSHLQSVADRPTTAKKKKKKKRIPATEGSYLAMGTVGANLTGSSVQPVDRSDAPQSARATRPSTTINPTDGILSADDFPDGAKSNLPPQLAAAMMMTSATFPSVQQATPLQTSPELEKPVEQANTSRKLESHPAPIEEESAVLDTPTELPREKARASVNLGVEASTTPVAPGSGMIGGDVRRAHSISPARKPHFSSRPVELENGIKHQPPPRSISPVKSALKRSPSSSVRTASPAATFQPGIEKAQSEVSGAEAEETPRRKKGVRVSFEAAPEAVLDGLEASRHAPANAARERAIPGDDFEDVMQPRPALPSFGSVRGRRKEDEEPPRPVRGIPQKTPSSMESSATLVDSEVSRDHAIGAIIAENFAARQSGANMTSLDAYTKPQNMDNLPLPPEVTSVEGTGYVSDSESVYSDRPDTPVHLPERIAIKTTELLKPEPSSIPLERENVDDTTLKKPEQNGPVPLIAVLPATPAAEEEKLQEPMLLVPGAFPSSASSLSIDQQGITKGLAPGLPSPRGPDPTAIESKRISEGAAASPESEQPAVWISGPVPAAIVDDESESTDSSSVYSDAAEDWEEGGSTFASLDAIVESPVKPGPGVAAAKLPRTTTPAVRETGQQTEPLSRPTAADWQVSTEYWRGLSKQKKIELETRELERVADRNAKGVPNVRDDAASQPQPPKSHKATKDRTRAVQPAIDSQPASQARPRQRAEGPKSVRSPPMAKVEPVLRKTMRGTDEPPGPSSPQAPKLKTSMRTREPAEPEGDSILPKTLRGQGTAEALSKSRWAPTSLDPSKAGLDASPNAPGKLRGALQKKNIPPAMAPEPRGPAKSRPLTLPTMPRRNSSDSESSFKRARTSSMAGQDGTFSLRRTMRAPQSPTIERPMSPVGRGRQMRSSLRASIDSGAPSLRNRTPTSTRSSIIPGFGKSKRKMDAASPPPAFRSRFANESDDEWDERDEPLTSRFQSRFAESDDDLDSPLPTSHDRLSELAPVRSVTQQLRDDDSDSTDLEDEVELSDAEPSPRRRRRMNAPAVPSSKDIEAATNVKPAQGRALAAGTMRNEAKPFDALAASKHAPGSAVSEPQTRKRRFSLPGFGRKKRESSVPPMPTFTAAAETEASAKSRAPRLTDADGKDEAAWPFPLAPRVSEGRPSTSDGSGLAAAAATRRRPDAGTRRVTLDDVQVAGQAPEPDREPGVVYGRRGKKKKFQTLRRAFGLRD